MTVREVMDQRAGYDAALAEAIHTERSRIMASLKERRKALGMTQEEVARLINKSRGQIANGELGRAGSGLSLEGVIAYAAAVGARIDVVDEEDR